jgi:hypothetical protein
MECKSQTIYTHNTGMDQCWQAPLFGVVKHEGFQVQVTGIQLNIFFRGTDTWTKLWNQPFDRIRPKIKTLENRFKFLRMQVHGSFFENLTSNLNFKCM